MSEEINEGPASFSAFTKTESFGNLLHGTVKDGGSVVGLNGITIGNLSDLNLTKNEIGAPVFLVDLPVKGPMPGDQVELSALGYEVRDYAFVSGRLRYSTKRNNTDMGWFFYQVKNTTDGINRTKRIKVYRPTPTGNFIIADGIFIKFTSSSNDYDQYSAAPSPDGTKIAVIKKTFDNKYKVSMFSLSNNDSGSVSVVESTIVDFTAGETVSSETPWSGKAPYSSVLLVHPDDFADAEAQLAEYREGISLPPLSSVDLTYYPSIACHGYDNSNVHKYIKVSVKSVNSQQSNGWQTYYYEVRPTSFNIRTWANIKTRIDQTITIGSLNYLNVKSYENDYDATGFVTEEENTGTWTGEILSSMVSKVNFCIFKIKTINQEIQNNVWVDISPQTEKTYWLSHTGVFQEAVPGKFCIFNPKTQQFVLTDTEAETII